ncbi:MAG: phosphatidylserine/phosphatidylglycerophosphate/cardiolipin synthase family protein [Candidatus Komeilibacteria bacterium]|nr:phosphatidylserine/phosphatidylglycerophosphate/cardiolipin synthase family protein [Candidatus Komeilibacteria bacterium]
MAKNYEFYTTSQEAWDAMEQVIKNAKDSIYWESYIFADDEIGQKFLQLLIEKKRQGLEVKLIFDAIGSYGFSLKKINDLRLAGLDLHFFHGRSGFGRYRSFVKRMWERTHRKILIIDKKIGFVGGINVKKDQADWLDLQVKIESPLVVLLLKEFAKNYFWAGGQDQSLKKLRRLKVRRVTDLINFVFAYPGSATSRSRQLMMRAIRQARHELIIVNSYFIPDWRFFHALKKAIRRKVTIKILLPHSTDLWFPTYAAQALWEYTQKLGAEIYTMPIMLHAKAVIVDQRWATIGSTNLDYRSFFFNHEINIVFSDPEMLIDLQEIISRWFAQATKLEERRWTKRKLWQRLKEWFASRFQKWL